MVHHISYPRVSVLCSTKTNVSNLVYLQQSKLSADFSFMPGNISCLEAFRPVQNVLSSVHTCKHRYEACTEHAGADKHDDKPMNPSPS